MADFKTHITASTLIGIGYGSIGHAMFDLRPEICVLAGGLCGIAGILPDVDSDSGQTVREITGFVAVLVPILLLDKILEFRLSHESLVVVVGSLYLLVRFGLTSLLKRMTVHRGMWHSIPAALCAGIVTSWLCLCPDLFPRFFKALAVIVGYVTHLTLDEYYSFEFRRGRFRIKKSLGTALKIWGDRPFGNFVVYSLLIGLFMIAFNDPQITGKPGHHPFYEIARQMIWKSDPSDTETRNVERVEPESNWIDEYDRFENDGHQH